METFHCSSAIKVLSQPNSNIVAALKNDDLIEFWTMLFECILSTNLSQHQKIIEEAEGKIRSTPSGSFDLSNQNERLLLMKILLKCAVFSNFARPKVIDHNWGSTLCETAISKTNTQFDKTQDIVLDSPLTIAKKQVEFLTNTCDPLFSLLARIETTLQPICGQLKINLQSWQQIIDDTERPINNE